MAKRHTNIGETFGRLTIIANAEGLGKRRERAFMCACACGNEKVVALRRMVSGKTSSCGCFSVEATAARQTTHGKATRKKQARSYEIWAGMVQRCTNPNASNWSRYGGAASLFATDGARSKTSWPTWVSHRPALKSTASTTMATTSRATVDGPRGRFNQETIGAM